MRRGIPGSEPFLHCVIDDRVYLAQNVSQPKGNFFSFDMDRFLCYESVLNDFGPENISSICRFIDSLDLQMKKDRALKIMCLVKKGRMLLTNSIFLVGAFMILKLKFTPTEIWEVFRNAPSVHVESQIEEYCDAYDSDSNFRLCLLDCWQALQRAFSLRWILCPISNEGMWGRLNLPEHEHYKSALNGNFVQVS